jgi:2-oxo-4-hydroxy-4-carboxy-5-ureidoimidazoline decarboxylase
MSTPADAPAEAAEPVRLAWFNGLPAAAAQRELLACCAAPAWAGQVAAGRPYESLGELDRRSDAAVAAMTQADLAAALAGHPRIGDRRVIDGGQAGRADGGVAGGGSQAGGGGTAAWSRQEQAGVAGAAEEITRALADGNAAYERRFGHIYLVCASGRSAAELLAVLRARLGNDHEAEWQVVRTELGKINQLRLRKLLAAPA